MNNNITEHKYARKIISKVATFTIGVVVGVSAVSFWKINKPFQEWKNTQIAHIDSTGQRFIHTPIPDSGCASFTAMDGRRFEEYIKEQGVHDTIEIGSSGKVLQSFNGCNRLIMCRHSENIQSMPHNWKMTKQEALDGSGISQASTQIGDTLFTLLTSGYRKTDVYTDRTIVTVTSPQYLPDSAKTIILRMVGEMHNVVYTNNAPPLILTRKSDNLYKAGKGSGPIIDMSSLTHYQLIK